MTATERDDPSPFESVEVPDLVEIVEQRLTEAIIDGRIPPGARIVEAEIARRMSVSRAPVREAARRLERQGVLVARPRHGFQVRTITVREVDDLFQVRMCLELAGIEAACVHGSEAGFDRAQAVIDRMVREARDLSPIQRMGLDLEFHTLLSELSGNAYLHRMYKGTQTEMRMIMALVDDSYEDPTEIALGHQPLIDALRARDTARAAAAMRFHLEEAWRHVRDLFVQQHGAQTEQATKKISKSSKEGTDARRSQRPSPGA